MTLTGVLRAAGFPAMGKRALSHRPLILVIAGLFIGAMVLIVGNAYYAESNLVEKLALQHAQRLSNMLATLRTVYTSDVVSRVTESGVLVTHDYAQRENAIPLPATLTMLLGNRIGQESGGETVRLYSPYPFPWRSEQGGLRDGFAREAWKYLGDNTDKEFYRVEVTDGQPVLRFASADLMRPACVNCHNTYPGTPKSDWKTGDLRGILEVGVPLGFSGSSLYSDLAESAGYTMLIAVAGLLVTSLLIVYVQGVLVQKDRSESTLKHLQDEISERLRVEKENKALEVELRHAQKLEAVGQLAGGIAHEINTPAQYIGDNLKFLNDAHTDLFSLVEKSAALTEAARGHGDLSVLAGEIDTVRDEIDIEYLRQEVPSATEQSLAGIEQVSRIVLAMKEFSHPGTKEKSLADINRALENTIAVSRNEWKHVAEMTTALDDALPAVSCLAGELNQVFLNLIVNAAHAIAEQPGRDDPGRITVSTESDGEYVTIRVADNGAGIPEHAREQIFNPFFTTKEVGHGTGQGLAIARDIVVKKHGGTIGFDTETGKGTTFTVKLPIRATRPARTTPPDGAEGEKST